MPEPGNLAWLREQIDRNPAWNTERDVPAIALASALLAVAEAAREYKLARAGGLRQEMFDAWRRVDIADVELDRAISREREQ